MKSKLLLRWLLCLAAAFSIARTTADAATQLETDIITTLPLDKTAYCVGSAVIVSFETNLTFPSDNIFTVQLSNSSGSFATPVVVGSAAGTTSGSITANVPANQTAGTKYRIRVVASKPSPNMTLQDNGVDFRIAAPPKPVTISHNSGLCEGATLTLSASNVTGATYAWVGPNNFTSPERIVLLPNVSTQAAGIYSVTVTLNGCSVTTNLTVDVKAAPATVSANQVICLGESTQLSASGGTSYKWTPASTLSDATIADPIATPTATTTYTVAISYANGCTRTKQVVVTVNPRPVITIAPAVASICKGASVQLQASGGATYAWSPATGLDDATSASPMASPEITTTYTVTATSAAGCVNTKTIVVTVKALPVANAGFDRSICSGQVLTMGGTTTSSGTYLWEPATGLSSATGKNPILTIQNTTERPITQTYTLTVTSAGCVTTDQVSITVNPAINANAGPDATICAGGDTQLNASGGVFYRWSPTTNLSDPNSANPVAFPTVTTRYIVTVTNLEGCSRNDTVFVNVNPKPILVVTPAAPSFCEGLSVQLQATGATTYLWSPATGLSDPTIANPIASPASTTIYTVTGFNATGCEGASKTVTVKVNPYPVAKAGPDKVVCAWQGTIIGTPAVTGYTYQWSPAIGLNNPKAANPTLTYPSDLLTPIKVEYTLTVTANGCSSTDVMEVTVNPTAYAGPAVGICPNGSTQLQASGGSSYRWSPATGLSDPFIANPIASPTVTTTYTVTVIDAQGLCSNTASVRVTANPNPVITATASATETVCQGTPVTLTATGGATYVWSPSIGLSNPNIASPIATPSVTTTYTVTGTSKAGCSSTAEVTVQVNPAEATISASGSTAICPGGSVTLTASEGASYDWSTGATTKTITVSTAGSYSVTVTQASGCEATSTPTIITEAAEPTVALEPFNPVCLENNYVELTGGTPAGGTYSGVGVSNNIFSAVTAGTGTHAITYTYVTENGCSASATQNITVSLCLSAAEALQETLVQVYPNPAQGELFFEATLTQKEAITITLKDLNGKVVLLEKMNALPGLLKKTFSLKNLAQGVYVLQYRTASALTSRKVVITR